MVGVVLGSRAGVQLLFTVSDVLAQSPLGVVEPVVLWSFLSQILIGQVFFWQFVAALLVALMSWAIASRWSAWVVLLIALMGAAAPALLGHGGLDLAHVATTVSLGLHIAAISLWVGGLAVVVALLVVTPDLGRELLPRFSMMALCCVVVVAESGPAERIAAAGIVQPVHGDLVRHVGPGQGGSARLAHPPGMAAAPARHHHTGARPVITKGLLVRYASWEFAVMGTAIAISIVMSRVGPVPVAATGASMTPITVTLLGAGYPVADRPMPPGGADGLARPDAGVPGTPGDRSAGPDRRGRGGGGATGVAGPGGGGMAGAAALVAVGWVFVACVTGPRGRVGVIVAMVGWPLVTWLVHRLTATPATSGWSSQVLGVLLAEALLASMLIRTPTRVDVIAPTTVAVAG